MYRSIQPSTLLDSSIITLLLFDSLTIACLQILPFTRLLVRVYQDYRVCHESSTWLYLFLWHLVFVVQQLPVVCIFFYCANSY